MAPKLDPRAQHHSLVLVFAFLLRGRRGTVATPFSFCWQVWHFSHMAFELPQGVQHGIQVGTQAVARGPASLQVGPLWCNMAPAFGPRYLPWRLSRPQEVRYDAQVAPRAQHGFLVSVLVSAFAWQAWHFNHWAHFFAGGCGTLATWLSSWPQEVQHGLPGSAKEHTSISAYACKHVSSTPSLRPCARSTFPKTHSRAVRLITVWRANWELDPLTLSLIHI